MSKSERSAWDSDDDCEFEQKDRKKSKYKTGEDYKTRKNYIGDWDQNDSPSRKFIKKEFSDAIPKNVVVDITNLILQRYMKKKKVDRVVQRGEKCIYKYLDEHWEEFRPYFEAIQMDVDVAGLMERYNPPWGFQE